MKKGISKKNRFDKPKKGREWHTAFYYLAEHLKALTGGELNHKCLYALVGMEGRFVNSDKQAVRKAYAGKLSKLVHSKSYATEMQARYLESALTFDDAAREICNAIQKISHMTDSELSEYWAKICWPDVWYGLMNEKQEWRGTLDLVRIGYEASSIFGNAENESAAPSKRAITPIEQLSAMFWFISFGHLEIPDGSPEPKTVISSRPAPNDSKDATRACLVRYDDRACLCVKDIYVLPMERPFTIGRLTDNDAIEEMPSVGREHGCVFRLGKTWYYEDRKSLNGSAIIRDDVRILCNSNSEFVRIPLQAGDIIEIAEASYYRFSPYSGYSFLQVKERKYRDTDWNRADERPTSQLLFTA